MAVSNPATMSSVYAEFGAPASTPLSAFLRGGAWVSNGPTANAGVPTALPISLSQLAGAIKQNLTASASPTTVTGSSATSGVIGTGGTTCTPAGLIGTASYQWHVTTTGGPAISITSATNATTNFTASLSNLNPSATGTAYCTVTDGTTGATANTGTVSISITYTGP